MKQLVNYLCIFIAAIFLNLAHANLDKIFARNSIVDFGLQNEEVVLTIDDGPSPATVKILDLLKDYNIQASFFVTGGQAKLYPEIMERMASEGHIIANHTSTHLFDYPTTERIYGDILDTHEVIQTYIEKSQTKRLYFRSPGGVWNDWRYNVLNDHPIIKQYIGPIYWNVGGQLIFNRKREVLQSADWDCWKRGINTSTCATGYYRELLKKGKGVILMHDIKMESYHMLKELLEKMMVEGTDGQGHGQWVFKSLDDLEALDQFEL